MASRLEFQKNFIELGQELNDEELSDTLIKLVSHREWGAGELLNLIASNCPLMESDLFDAAASLAARHHALAGDEFELRSWLTLLALRSDVARQIGEEPRQVIDKIGQSVLTQAKIQGEAIQTIWREPMVQPGIAAVALGAKVTNREKVRQYRERSWLLGLPSGRKFLYPEFQFDPEQRDVFHVVRAVNEQLAAADDPWGVASWWISANDRLGTRPIDLVGSDREHDLVASARALTEPVG